jgi:hypothetical protein
MPLPLDPKYPLEIKDFNPSTETSSRYLSGIAQHLNTELNLDGIDDKRLTVIALAALRVQELLFIAALHEPTAHDYQDLLEDFICRALTAGETVQ